jgi:hypothetical protein
MNNVDTKPITTHTMYRAGLMSRMSDYAHESIICLGQQIAHGGSPLLAAYAEGILDGDDDSDDPRPSGPAADDERGAVEPHDMDEDELRAVAALIYAELERVDADVSAWPEYATGRIRMVDDIADEALEPCALLATLRGLDAGAGTEAMWRATSELRGAGARFWSASPHTP